MCEPANQFWAGCRQGTALAAKPQEAAVGLIPDTVERGHRIEVLAPSKRWREATVLKVKGETALVHYEGYDEQYDERVKLTSVRVRQHGEIRRSELAELKANFEPAASMVGCCNGCGVKLQCENRTKPGYIPPHYFNPMTEPDTMANEILDPEEEVALLLDAEVGEREDQWSKPKYERRSVQTSFRVTANVYLDIRKEPDINAEKAGDHFLKFGDTFEACEVYRSPDARNYMKLADGRGWVFDWAMIDNVRTQLIEPITGDDRTKIQEEKRKFKKVCMRCWGLWQYNDCDDILRPDYGNNDEDLTAQKFEEMLRTTLAPVEIGCVLAVVDVFDFGPSFKMLQFLAKQLQNKGRVRVRVVANKLDLLPREVDWIRLRGWVSREAKRAGLPRVKLTDVFPVSCHKGTGLKAITKLLQRTDAEKAWYVVGAANAGKSSLLNRLSLRKRKGVGEQAAIASDGATVSPLPGTTLKPMVLRMRRGKMKLMDTPGLLVPGTLTTKLPMTDLLNVIPQTKGSRRVTLHMTEGRSILLGGLARIDLVKGRPYQFTVFTSEKVNLHRCYVDNIERSYDRMLGDTLSPPASARVAHDLQPFVCHQFHLDGAGWLEASADVVFHGLGWVSFTGSGEFTVEAWAPEGVEVTLRQPLMPFEAKWTGVKYRGAPGWFQIGKRVTRATEVGRVRRKFPDMKF